MGNKKNVDKWPPAEPLRILAFAYSLVPDVSRAHLGRKIKASDIQKALEGSALKEPLSDEAINKWLSGKNRPKPKNVADIELTFPGCADWLKSDIDSSPMRRFLCALDIWGSPIDSPARKLDSAAKIITVGDGLAILAKRWGPVLMKDSLCEYVIPRLKRYVPSQVPDTVYQSFNLLTLMDFMFRCGPYLELSDEEFTEWAIDLASLTLMIGAILEGASITKRSQSGRAGDFNWVVHCIFFRTHGNWPNVESVSGKLKDFSELDDSAIAHYSKRLMRAREALNKELLAIGSDLSIVEELSSRIKVCNKMCQEPLRAHDETFDQSDLIRVKRNISPAAPDRYRYELRHLSSGKRIALCHDLELETQAPLLERPDLYKGDESSISWGYSGHGPTLLSYSILAHHLGHDDFGIEEIDRLLDRFISRLPENRIEISFFLTTELIDTCLNE